MNFIALGVIAEIDDIYARTLYNSPIKNKLEDPNYEPLRIMDKSESKIIQKHQTLILGKDEFGLQKWYMPTTVFHWIMKTFYQCYYFYFMPLSALALTFYQNY